MGQYAIISIPFFIISLRLSLNSVFFLFVQYIDDMVRVQVCVCVNVKLYMRLCGLWGQRKKERTKKCVHAVCAVQWNVPAIKRCEQERERIGDLGARVCVCVYVCLKSECVCVCACVFFSSFVHFFQFVQESVLLLLLLFTVGCFLPQSLCISTVLWQNYREYVVFVPCNDILRCVLQFTVCIARRCCVVSCNSYYVVLSSQYPSLCLARHIPFQFLCVVHSSFELHYSAVFISYFIFIFIWLFCCSFLIWFDMTDF